MYSHPHKIRSQTIKHIFESERLLHIRSFTSLKSTSCTKTATVMQWSHLLLAFMLGLLPVSSSNQIDLTRPLRHFEGCSVEIIQTTVLTQLSLRSIPSSTLDISYNTVPIYMALFHYNLTSNGKLLCNHEKNTLKYNLASPKRRKSIYKISNRAHSCISIL